MQEHEINAYVNRLQQEIDRIFAVTPEQIGGYLDRLQQTCDKYGVETDGKTLNQIKAELRAQGIVVGFDVRLP